jgi:GDP-L-fucose synthase
MIDKKTKIYVAGHTGMVGSAIVRKLRSEEYTNLILRTVNELDLINQNKTSRFFEKEKPEVVIIAAAKVGGILANNTLRAEFIYNNLMISANIIHAAYLNGVEKLIFLGSSCIYPKLASQPIKEEYLLTDLLEFTNEPYAIAKITGIKLCESYYRQYDSNFYSVMPTNLYGPNDNFDLNSSHVLPALIRKIHEAKTDKKKSFEIWGTGKPKREFLFVDDLADAIFFLLNNINASDLYQNNLTHLNVGTGEDLSISELAQKIKSIIGFEGEITYDSTKPDGTPRKLLDVTRINKLGWNYKTSLEEGIQKTYNWFLTHQT